MYLGRLANGSGDPRGPSAFQRRRERLQACRSKNALAYDWTIAKLGQPGLVGQLGIWGKYSPLHTQGVIPDPTIFTECDNGYPMYMQFQFQEAARKLIPTAQETAEAFVEEIKTVAPTMPVEKPTVVTPPDSRLAPPPPILFAQDQPLVTTGLPQSLIDRYREQTQTLVTTPVDSRAPAPIDEGAAPPAEKPGVGIGTVLALGIPLVLAMAG